MRIKANTKKGFYEIKEKVSVIDVSYPTSTLRRGRVQEGGTVSPTLTTNESSLNVLKQQESENDFRIRKLTERECFRLMGVRDDDIDTMKNSGVSKSQLYKMAGNSIVCDVLMDIFNKMFIETEPAKGTQLTIF